jgi:hypothetical protein
MQLVDALAIVLVLAAATAFFLGERGLAASEDVRAAYWLVVGVVSLIAAVRMTKPGGKA